MFYVNQNKTLTQLENLVHENMQHLPESFKEEQEKALELFQKRLFLEEVIEETTSFNRKLIWENEDKNLQLATTAEALFKVFKLRSEIYLKSNYSHEIPDTIEGLNFDLFDKNSAVIYYRIDNEIIATLRVIFDSKDKLPSEEKYSFNPMRKTYGKIAEVSRLVVKHQNSGLNLGFRYMMKGLHTVFNQNDLAMTISGIKKEHFKLYSKLGGVDIIDEIPSYGSINVPFVIMTWDLSKTSKFFQRSFLK